jgi:glycosyltransferase involved in cell wall biosynthesis
MKKWYLFANFGTVEKRNGQIQKALALRTLLSQRFGADLVPVDLRARRLNLLEIAKGFRAAHTFCVSLGQNGIRAFAWVYLLCSKVYPRRWRPRIVYFVVGGWLPQFAASRPYLLRFLKELDTIFVEADGVAVELRKLGVQAQSFPNFRHRLFDRPKPAPGKPLRLCFCARIRHDKGPLLAIDMAEKLQSSGHPCILDFYGAIEPEIATEFQSRLRDGVISYRGSYESEDEAVAIMREYDFLLLPTSYHGECMPGALVEAFCAATPVIAADWRFMSEFVEHGTDGLVVALPQFAADAATEVVKVLREDKYAQLSRACLSRASHTYSEAAASSILDGLAHFQRG